MSFGFGSSSSSSSGNSGDQTLHDAVPGNVTAVRWAPVHDNSAYLSVSYWDGSVCNWFGNLGYSDGWGSGTDATFSLDGVASFNSPVLSMDISSKGPIMCGLANGCVKYTYPAQHTSPPVQIGQQFDTPVIGLNMFDEVGGLACTAMDGTIRMISISSALTKETSVPFRPFTTTHRGDYLGVAGAFDVAVFDVRKLDGGSVYNFTSPLKYKTRCFSFFQSGASDGCILGSIEGRCAVQYFSEANKNFAYKCHRNGSGKSCKIYAVTSIDFHSAWGTFATTGSDGTFNFWDKDQKVRLKPFKKEDMPINDGRFSPTGKLYAYAASDDGSFGDSGASPQCIVRVHKVAENEVKPKNK